MRFGIWGAVGTTDGGTGGWAWVSVGWVGDLAGHVHLGDLPAASALFATTPKLFLPHSYKRKQGGKRGREGRRKRQGNERKGENHGMK